MPLLNPATGGYHDFTSLTDQINRVEYQPRQLGDAVTVVSRGLRDRTAIIDRKSTSLDIIDPIAWDAKPSVVEVEDYESFPILVPHRQELVTVRPAEVRSKRRMGSETEYEMPTDRLNEKFEKVKGKFALTDEHQLINACRGKLIRKNGSVYLDLAAQFGIGPSNYTIDFDDADLDVVASGRMLKRQQEQKLGDYMVEKWQWFLPAEYFEALVNKESIKRAYDRWMDGAFLRADNRSGFPIADNVEVIEYRNITLPGGADFFPTDESLFLPITNGLYQRRYAPREDMNHINSEGLPFYAVPNDLDFAEGVDIKVESNAVTYVQRPEAVGIVKQQ